MPTTVLTPDDGPIVVLSRPAPGQPLQSVYLEVVGDNENHKSENTITDHPVEEGSNISDHSRPEPEMVSAEVTVSNTPITPGQQTTAVSSGGFTFKVNAVDAVKIGDVNGYAQQALDKLTKLKNEGTRIVLVTSKRTYRSMLIQSIVRVETAKTYDALVAQVSFKEVIVVQNGLTTAPTTDNKAQVKPKSQGQKTNGDPVEDPDTPLAQGLDWVAKKTGINIPGFGR